MAYNKYEKEGHYLLPNPAISYDHEARFRNVGACNQYAHELTEQKRRSGDSRTVYVSEPDRKRCFLVFQRRTGNYRVVEREIVAVGGIPWTNDEVFYHPMQAEISLAEQNFSRGPGDRIFGHSIAAVEERNWRGRRTGRLRGAHVVKPSVANGCRRLLKAPVYAAAIGSLALTLYFCAEVFAADESNPIVPVPALVQPDWESASSPDNGINIQSQQAIGSGGSQAPVR